MSEELTPIKGWKVSGIGKLTLERVSRVVSYVEDLALFNPEELADRAGIDVERATVLVREARRLVREKTGLRRVFRGSEYARILDSRGMFTTGVKAIDELLGGGIYVWDIYEFAGEFGSGKTQLCHQLSVTVQLPPGKGGLGGATIFIDTEGTFSPSRVEAMGKKFGVENPLENIYVIRPLNVDELEELVIEEMPSLLREGARLLIVDSIIALYRAQFKGREMLAARQQRINYLLDWLKRYARRYNLAIAITNQVLSQPVPWGAALKLPAGGNIMAHATTHRFLLRRSGSEWVIECLDSPRIARGASAKFLITSRGVEDVR